MKIELGHDFRADGMFLIRKQCVHCKEDFDVFALAGSRGFPYDALCSACCAVYDMERMVKP